MKEKTREYPIAVVVFGILLAFLSYRTVLASLPDHLSDFNGHTYVYLPFFFRKETLSQGLGAAPYCLWHLITLFGYKILRIPLENAAAYTNALFAVLSYMVFVWFIRKISERTNRPMGSMAAAAISFGLCILQPLEAEWMKVAGAGLSPFSLNPLHNPTYLAVRPFSVLCFCLVADIWGKQRDEGYHGIFFRVENGLKKYYIALSVILFLSAAAKPTFAEMFIPSVGLMMLIYWGREALKKDGSGRKAFGQLLALFITALPAIIYILIQFFAYFIFGGSYGDGGSLVITPFLYVWGLFTENVGLSLLLAMAFPLFVFLLDSRNILQSLMGKLALFSFAVSFLEAAFLGESTKLTHGDFLWPMISGMLLVYLAALADLIALEGEDEESPVKRGLLLIAWGLFGVQVLCGVLYASSMIAA